MFYTGYAIMKDKFKIPNALIHCNKILQDKTNRYCLDISADKQYKL